MKRPTKKTPPTFPGMKVKSSVSLQPRSASISPILHLPSAPLIGILAADGGNFFFGNRQNFADLIRTGREMGVQIAVLTPSGIQENGQSVKGFTLDYSKSDKNRWLPARFPLPPVIYNRLPNRKVEKKPHVKKLLQELLASQKVYLFNPSFFDKWTFFKHMKESTDLHSLLPDTARLDSPTTLINMLKRHHDLYLKPIEGKAGIGMMRLRSVPRGWELIHQTTKEKRKRILPHFSSCYKLIKKYVQHKPYLIQQTIPLATYQGQPFDVRMLLQKDGNGTWQVTGIGIRVAGKEAISTHVPMGGRIAHFDDVLADIFGKDIDTLRERLEQTGLAVAQWLEQKQGHTLGEMSLDLGIETSGRIWVFEANAKPQKFDEPDIRARSLERLIQYADYMKKRLGSHENISAQSSGN